MAEPTLPPQGRTLSADDALLAKLNYLAVSREASEPSTARVAAEAAGRVRELIGEVGAMRCARDWSEVGRQRALAAEHAQWERAERAERGLRRIAGTHGLASRAGRIARAVTEGRADG